MVRGPLHRKLSNQKRYKKYLSTHPPSKSCPFCITSKNDGGVIVEQEFSHFWLLKTRFGYDLWDNYGVADHLMVVPKRHVIGFCEYNTDELKEFHQIVSLFEAQGYNLYQRAPGVQTKSIPHQHGHLILLDSKQKKFVFYSSRPYVTWY